MKAILEESTESNLATPKRNVSSIELPSFLHEIGKGKTIGVVNMEEVDLSELVNNITKGKNILPVHFEQASELFKWEDLFPEWIDEEEESDVPTCPEIPMPDFKSYENNMDVIVAKLPCKYQDDEGWRRDVFRLQVHLVVANLAVKKGRRNTKVALWSKCRPMLEMFRCNDLVGREGDWWLYEPDLATLEQKMSLPVGSCKLALPLWGQGTLSNFTTLFS